MNWIINKGISKVPLGMNLLCQLRSGEYAVLRFSFDDEYQAVIANYFEVYVDQEEVVKYCLIV